MLPSWTCHGSSMLSSSLQGPASLGQCFFLDFNSFEGKFLCSVISDLGPHPPCQDGDAHHVSPPAAGYCVPRDGPCVQRCAPEKLKRGGKLASINLPGLAFAPRNLPWPARSPEIGSVDKEQMFRSLVIRSREHTWTHHLSQAIEAPAWLTEQARADFSSPHPDGCPSWTFHPKKDGVVGPDYWSNWLAEATNQTLTFERPIVRV